jgi:hypothetical protein
MKQQVENDVTREARQPAAQRMTAVSADSSEIEAKVAYQLSKERQPEGDLNEQDWRRARVIVLKRLAAKKLVAPFLR